MIWFPNQHWSNTMYLTSMCTLVPELICNYIITLLQFLMLISVLFRQILLLWHKSHINHCSSSIQSFQEWRALLKQKYILTWFWSTLLSELFPFLILLIYPNLSFIGKGVFKDVQDASYWDTNKFTEYTPGFAYSGFCSTIF